MARITHYSDFNEGLRQHNKRRSLHEWKQYITEFLRSDRGYLSRGNRMGRREIEIGENAGYMLTSYTD